MELSYVLASCGGARIGLANEVGIDLWDGMSWKLGFIWEERTKLCPIQQKATCQHIEASLLVQATATSLSFRTLKKK